MQNNLYQELEKNFRDLHESQLRSTGLPEIYWNTLFEKVKNEIFDAGNYFQICMRVDEEDQVLGYKAVCTNESGLKINDSNGIFLVDHAWTYKVNDARQNLTDHPSLLNRMCIMMSITVSEEDQDSETIRKMKIEAVLDKMWKFNQMYKLSTEKLTDEEREPLWYVMDEFGSSIRHNDTPTVKCAPFFYLPTATMYSLIWPLTDLEYGDELTRDYVYGIKDEKLRKAKLFPWNDEDEEYLEFLKENDSNNQEEPGIEYFNSGREGETLPDEIDLELVNISRLNLNTNNNLINVFTDMKSIRDNLTDPKFTFVDDLWKADIIFMKKHFKDYKGLREKSPNTLINQFPFENVVTVKDLLAIVCRRVSDSDKWLPITYNLAYELSKFICYYKKREEKGLDNHWILKPWNLARSIDTTVTKNLNQIIRSQETGPKISCKYITDPVLFYRDELKGSVKFDVRYIVLVRSIKPLVIYTYNVFWLRFANKPYSLDHLDDYEKHFTVMNYKPSVVLKQIHYNEFIPMFEEQNEPFKWTEVQSKIFKMIRQVFEGASKEEPPKGISHNYQSRAMYAVDLMLDWRMSEDTKTKMIEPMICEINFMPDCTRACKYHPNFFNDIFSTLFLDCLDHKNVTKI